MELGNRTKEFDVVGFGEIMLRLSPTGLERLSQCETLEKRPGGSELNVVSGISLLGLRTAVITKVPDNDMGRFIKNKIRFYGVSDDCLIYDQSDKKRIGIYYYESGAYPRKPAVMYDRAYSSINSISVDEINPAIYQDTRVFHTSGISLALSRNCRTAAVENDMVHKRYFHHRPKQPYPFCNFQICSAGCGVTAGMIVDQHDLYCFFSECHDK